MLPNHASKRGIRYRYYVSAKDKERLKLPVWRVPAGDLEAFVTRQLAGEGLAETQHPLNKKEAAALIDRVTVQRDRIEIILKDATGISAPIVVPATLISRSGERRFSAPDHEASVTRPDAPLLKLIVRAFQARQLVEAADTNSLTAAAAKVGLSSAYLGVLLRLSYLAPDIVAAILDGRQPATLNRQRLARVAALPLDWKGQRALLGFA